MLETLRERLLSVQQDFTSGLKTLSDKSKEAKVKSKPRTVSYLPKYSAGLELLSRYEDTWAALHRRAKECAGAGEQVDSKVVMLSAHWEKKKTSLIDLQEQLQQLPGLIADLGSVTANLTHLEASFEEIENHLLNLEDLCAQCELERYKHMQSQQLENYKKNKRASCHLDISPCIYQQTSQEQHAPNYLPQQNLTCSCLSEASPSTDVPSPQTWGHWHLILPLLPSPLSSQSIQSNVS